MSLMDAHISIETDSDGERSLLPDGWNWEDKRSSVYAGLGEEETLAAYRRRIRRLRVLAIAGVLVFLAGALASIFWLDSLFWYLLSLAGCIASAVWYWSRASLAFLGLADLVYLDCDPARYRFALERVGGRHDRGEGESLRTLELAYCDYLEGDTAGALVRLQKVQFKKASNVLWFRAMQVEAYARMELGDSDGLADTFARMHMFIDGMKPASRQRAVAADALAAMELQAVPEAAWGEFELGRAQDHLARSERHIECSSWCIRLAAYGAAHGMVRQARAILEDGRMEPLAPVHENRRLGLLTQIETAAHALDAQRCDCSR